MSMMREENYWQAVMERDSGSDGAFVYGVRSTGVYCRPSCPSRRPGREQVTFFPAAAAAEREGFRACLRCKPHGAAAPDVQAERVQSVCRFIEKHVGESLPLDRLAEHGGVS